MPLLEWFKHKSLTTDVLGYAAESSLSVSETDALLDKTPTTDHGYESDNEADDKIKAKVAEGELRITFHLRSCKLSKNIRFASVWLSA